MRHRGRAIGCCYYTFDGCEFRRCGVAIDCDHGNFYVRNCHFEGSRVVDIRDGSEHCSSIRRSTSLGSQALRFQTRLASIVTHGLYLRDNHSIVMSDSYVEQADNGYLFEGAAEAPSGRATITGAKFHSFTSDDPAKNNLLDLRNYHGVIAIGPYQLYQEPKWMRVKQQGVEPVDLLL